MEFAIYTHKKDIAFEWNGEVELMKLKLEEHFSRAIRFRIYLIIPNMPISHITCLKNRIRRVLKSKLGSRYQAASKLLKLYKTSKPKLGLTIDDDEIISFVESTGLDDIARDIDLLAFHINEKVA